VATVRGGADGSLTSHGLCDTVTLSERNVPVSLRMPGRLPGSLCSAVNFHGCYFVVRLRKVLITAAPVCLDEYVCEAGLLNSVNAVLISSVGRVPPVRLTGAAAGRVLHRWVRWQGLDGWLRQRPPTPRQVGKKSEQNNCNAK
jgi:hypothetical protein